MKCRCLSTQFLFLPSAFHTFTLSSKGHEHKTNYNYIKLPNICETTNIIKIQNKNVGRDTLENTITLE